MARIKKSFSNEQKRWKDALKDENARFIDCAVAINDVIDAHFTLAGFQSELRLTTNCEGCLGAIDGQKLISAVSAQKDVMSDRGNPNADFERCSNLFYGLIKNAPFQRLNSSTALLSMLFYLLKIKRVPAVHQKEIEVITRIIASNEIRQRRTFEPYSTFDGGEIIFLAQYLQKNTRPLEKKDLFITYSELNDLLKGHGLALTNSCGPTIDVVRKNATCLKFKLFRDKSRFNRLGAINFDGWTNRVPGSQLRRLNEVTGLELGIDVNDQGSILNKTLQLRSLLHTYLTVFQRIAEDDEKRAQ